MKMLFALSALLFSFAAHAGSATLTCQTKENDIRYSAGNGSNTIQIDYIDSKTKQKGTHEVPVLALPYYDYNSEGGDDAIMSMPVSDKKYATKKCSQIHVIDAQGKECFGREFWEISYTQTFVLSGNGGKSLHSVLRDREVPGKISDGYIVREFQCTDEGVTTPGGCFQDPSDQVSEEIEVDCGELGY